MKIYLAGPLFTTGERDFNSQLSKRLEERGHEVWLPQDSAQESMTPKQIFEEDVRGIDWADVVVANMDGPDPDSGTCWECGYAYRKKLIVLFRTDFRVSHEVSVDLEVVMDRDKVPYNLMLTESADAHLELPFKAVDDVAMSIDRTLSNLSITAKLSAQV